MNEMKTILCKCIDHLNDVYCMKETDENHLELSLTRITAKGDEI